MSLKPQIYLPLLIAGALSGCASGGVYVHEDQLATFQKGQTTQQQVLQALGEPSQRILDSNGLTTLVYSYFEATSRPETFIPIVGGLVGGSDVRTNVVTLTFDQEGKLQTYSAAGSQSGMGSNLSSGVMPERVNSRTREPGQSVVGHD